MQLKKIIRLYWKSISVVMFILYLSFAPPSSFKKIPSFENEDKIIHFLMYAGLTVVMIYDFRKHTKNNASTFIFVVACVFFPSFFGGLIEILQPTLFAPRTGSIGDFYADILGVFAGWLTMYVWNKTNKKN